MALLASIPHDDLKQNLSGKAYFLSGKPNPTTKALAELGSAELGYKVISIGLNMMNQSMLTDFKLGTVGMVMSVTYQRLRSSEFPVIRCGRVASGVPPAAL